MSETSLQKIADKFMAAVEAECSAGRGEEHLLAYLRQTGVATAESVFLKMTVELERATDETAETVLGWAQDYPCHVANIMAQSVRESFTRCGFALGPESEKCEEAAVTSFTERLDALFGTVQPGGSA